MQPQQASDVFGVVTRTGIYVQKIIVLISPPCFFNMQPQFLPQFQPTSLQKPVNYKLLAGITAAFCCPLLGALGVYYSNLVRQFKMYNVPVHQISYNKSNTCRHYMYIGDVFCT